MICYKWGGALLLFIAASTASAQSIGPQPKTTLLDYGGRGDSNGNPGSGFDNTTALRAAVAAAQSSGRFTIRIPGGIYRWTDTVDVSGVTILCDSNSSTFLKFDDSSGIKDGFTVGHATFNLINCNYDRAQDGAAGALIHFTDSYFSQVYGNRFDGPHAWNIITVDSSTVEPNQFFIYNNQVHQFRNDFTFENSQNAAYPVYDFHTYDNFISSSVGRAAHELVGYGQINSHNETMTGGTAYNIYINTVDDPSVNTLSQITNDIFDVALTEGLHVENHGDVYITGGTGKTTYKNVNGLYITGGINFLPTTMIGVSDVHWNGTVQGNSPFTVQPNGATASTKLHFTGTWNEGGSTSFLTFNGGTPVADDVEVNVSLSDNEKIGTFTNPPTNWRNHGNSSGPASPPTFSSCTGTGATGVCSLVTGSTNEEGTINMTTGGGGEAGTGIVQLEFGGGTIGPSFTNCVLTPQNNDGFWVVPPTLILQGTTAAHMNFAWTNGGSTALTDAKSYLVNYHCTGR